MMSVPRIVSADEWLAERKELQAAEEQAAKALASVSERRRELPPSWWRRNTCSRDRTGR
jgi:predicted dithiol-disulfide oxidoreductase (DUF899 family)